MIKLQFTCRKELLWTFTANTRLYTFMSTYVFRKHIVYKLAVMVYKCLYGLVPPYLAVECVPVTSLASRHLWSAQSSCLVNGAKTALGMRNFAVAGAKIWNNLPADLRLHSQSLLMFGQRLKRYLFVCHERI